MKHHTVTYALTFCLIACAGSARAQYSDPPDGPVIVDQEPADLPPHPPADAYDAEPPHYPSSTVRLQTGPALLLSEHDPDAGLFAALDLGSDAAGFRLSGSWIRAGSARGVSQYTGELWLDLGHGRRLHPIIGTGAGLARVEVPDPVSDEPQSATVGVGVLRGSLQYVLPVHGTDARASFDVIGSLPAVRDSEHAHVNPWALVVLTVGVGF